MQEGHELKIYLDPEHPEIFRVAKSAWEFFTENIIGTLIFAAICILFVGVFIHILPTKEKKKGNDSSQEMKKSSDSPEEKKEKKKDISCLVVIIAAFAVAGVWLYAQGIGRAQRTAEIKGTMVQCTATNINVETGYDHTKDKPLYQSYLDYTYEGKDYTGEADNHLKAGQKLTIYVEPDNLEEFHTLTSPTV
jgi:hypothetical protein